MVVAGQKVILMLWYQGYAKLWQSPPFSSISYATIQLGCWPNLRFMEEHDDIQPCSVYYPVGFHLWALRSTRLALRKSMVMSFRDMSCRIEVHTE